MHSTAEKTYHSTTAVQQKAQQQPSFFKKAGEESFFGAKEKNTFFNAPVQAKLSVSSPDDPQEKEADAVADKVMRMAEPAPATVAAKEEEKLQRKENEPQTEPTAREELQAKALVPEITVQRKPQAEPTAREEGDEDVQAKAETPEITVQRKENDEALQAKNEAAEISVQRQPQAEPQAGEEAEEDEVQAKLEMPPITVQRSADDEQEPVQAKMGMPETQVQRKKENEPQEVQAKLYHNIHRSTNEAAIAASTETPGEEKDEPIQRKNMGQYHSDVVQRKGRAPPAEPIPSFQQNLASTKGQGSAMPDSTKQFMESHFSADFSGVRIHTDSPAQQMSSSIGAQAFTHGNDIYFNQGKFSPQTAGGGALLAHELTHTIQQGASQKLANVPTPAVPTPTAPDKTAPPKDGATATDTKEEKPTGRGPATAAATAPVVANSPPATGTNEAETDTATATAEGPTAANATTATGTNETATGSAPAAAAGSTAANAPPAAKDKAVPAEAATAPGATAAAPVPENAAGAEASEKTMPRAPNSIEEDAAYQLVVDKTGKLAKQKAKHPKGSAKGAEVSAAAVSPGNEVDALAQGNQVGEMEQEPNPFDREAFKKALMDKIESTTPKTLEEADDFKDKNKINDLKPELNGKVKESKEASQKNIADKAKETPSTEGIEKRTDVPLQEMPAGDKPKLNGEGAAPKPKTPEEISLQQGSTELDNQYAEEDIDSEQLQQSNEPTFVKADNNKSEAQADAQQAPVEYRTEEEALLAKARQQADGNVDKKGMAMHGAREKNFGAVLGKQGNSKSKDEANRLKVANDLQAIYNATKQAVENKLTALDTKVNTLFDSGAAVARELFERHVDERMRKYKSDRYSGIIGKGRWVKDKLFDLPSEVNVFFEEGKQLFIGHMAKVIDAIAQTVETELTGAKNLVTEGKLKVANYVKSQKGDLKKIATDAAANIEGQFDALENTIAEKQNELIDTLAKKYNEKLQQVNDRITAMKEANKGLVTKAKEAIKAVIQAIKRLKDMLLNILAKVANVVMQIIKAPIRFLGNLIKAVGMGLGAFVDNIEKHMKEGLLKWLLGNIPGGIEFPKEWDLKGIFHFVMQVIGLTWANIRARAVAKLGEPVMKVMEGTFDIFMVIQKEGLPGLWQFIKEKVGDLQTMVMGQITTFLIEKAIKAGVSWIMGLLNPAGAFIKACQLIYSIVMFFKERAAQIAELFNSIVNSIAAIVAGNLGEAAKKVETALANFIPVAIGFLAALVGLNGVTERVQKIIKAVQTPINKAIDWVLDKAIAFSKKLGIDKAVAKVKGSVDKAKEKVVETVKKGKDKVLGWLGWKKTFKTKSGESHTLFIDEAGKNKKVMIASVPRVLADIVHEREAQLKDENKQDASKVSINAPKLTALSSIAVVQKDVTTLLAKYAVAVDKASDKEAKDLKKQINDAMNDIYVKLMIADIYEDPSDTVETRVENQKDGDGNPQKVIAQPLTKIPGNTNGSTPQEEPLGWQYLDPAVRKNSWVAAHLLNHHLHGPGLQWNLVCGTKETNNNMKTEMERFAKEKVLNSTTKQYFYEVKVHYLKEQPGKAFLKHFPSKIEVKFGELSGVPGSYKQEASFERPFTQDSPEVTNVTIPAFNESSSSTLFKAAQRAGAAVPASVFDNIILVRRSISTHSFGDSAADMVAALDNYYATSGKMNAGEFTNKYGTALINLTHNHIFMSY